MTNPMTPPMSILIVDDHEVVRNGIRAYLGTLPEFNVVGEAVSGEEAISMVAELIPDIVLLDLSLPDGNDIVLAFKNPAFAPRWRDVATQAKALRARTGLDFPKFAQRLERNSRLRYF